MNSSPSFSIYKPYRHHETQEEDQMMSRLYSDTPILPASLLTEAFKKILYKNTCAQYWCLTYWPLSGQRRRRLTKWTWNSGLGVPCSSQLRTGLGEPLESHDNLQVPVNACALWQFWTRLELKLRSWHGLGGSQGLEPIASANTSPRFGRGVFLFLEPDKYP